MSKIFDTFMFFNELDLLEIRLNILNDYVDYFVISEATVTFSGKSKPLYYEENKERFSNFHHKIIHNIVTDTPSNLRDFTKRQYFTDPYKSYKHKHNGKPLNELSLDFQREVFQRDSVINMLLLNANLDDIIIMSDLDEIPNPEILSNAIKQLQIYNIIHLKQKWFMYFLNNFCDHHWFGSHMCKFQYILENSIDLLQYHKEDEDQQSDVGHIMDNGGWHFSFLGGAEKVKEKLEAYSYQGGRSAKLLSIIDKFFTKRIEKKIANNQDIFLTNRKFNTMEIDNSFPDYIINNKNKYTHLIKI